MKKYFSMLVVAALGLFTSCSEDALVGGEEGGELTTISVTAPQLGLGTRAGATAFADPALSDMRVALIISTEDNRVITVTTKTHSFGTGSTPCTFEARLYKGKTYNLSVWADYGDTYYTIPTQPTTTAEAEATLPVVKMASNTITGNVNNYDAYFGNETKTLTGNETINIVLSRPFALVKVNTTDWDENAVKLAGYRPDAYATTFNAPTQLNLVSGIADAAADITTSAEIVAYDQDGNPKQLHYDYLFANTTASILNPFTVVYSQGGTASSDYTFENIPVQRNYQTNITGNILTKNGKINVTITPNWNQPATEIELKEVSTPSVANADLKDHKTDTNAKGYIVKTTPNDDNTIIIPENTKAASLAYTLENLGSENKITVKDETPGTATTTYPNDVTLKVPAGANPTVYVNTQSAHVTVIGDANVVYANTSENTFVVAEGSTVSKIVVEKGNVAVFGTVTSIERSTNPANPDATTIVNLYDGAVWTNWATEKTTANIKPIVNLGTYIFDPTGYNVEGSTVVANEGTPATWSVVVNEEWSTHAAASFSNISGTTITIMTAPELALLAKESEKYKAYTVKLGAYIDLGAYYWNPITSFEGTFDGQNYVISNMKLHGDTDKGFFNKLEGTVKDLVIANATVNVKGDDCGILAGKVGTVSITNVKIQKSTLTTTGERVGAIAGNCYAHIDGCEVTECSLTGTEQVGAVLGYMALGYVKNCKATQNAIHATLLRAGGLIGKAEAAYGNLGPNPSSPVCINNNTISGTVTATDANTVGGIAGQIMGDDPRYEILNNSIDVPGTNCPIGTLRASQSTKFTSVLEEKITGNTWTKATLDAKRYTYTNAETGAGDQIIWNGEPEDNWQWYAAKSFSQIDETNKIITITSPEELALFAKKINSGVTYSGYKFLIGQDLDMSAHYWQPIGYHQPEYKIYDYIDGQNHTISNIKVVGGSSDAYIGFISSGTHIVIKNLILDGVTLTYPTSVGYQSRGGAFVGHTYGVDMQNCHAKNVKITAGQKVGGLIGYIEGDINVPSTVKDCSVENVTIQDNNVPSEGIQCGGFICNVTLRDKNLPTNLITISGCSVKNVTIKDFNTLPYTYDWRQSVPHVFIGNVIQDYLGNETPSITVHSVVLENNTISGTNTVLPTCPYSSTYFGWAGNATETPTWKGHIYIDGQKWEPAE